MTSQECNKQLLNDIIQRNYIKYFQNGNQKTFSLIVNNGAVCCTNCITDSNYSDFEMDLGEIDFNKNLNICLDWYINNQCQCDINIIGQDDIDLFNKISNINLNDMITCAQEEDKKIGGTKQ